MPIEDPTKNVLLCSTYAEQIATMAKVVACTTKFCCSKQRGRAETKLSKLLLPLQMLPAGAAGAAATAITTATITHTCAIAGFL